LSRWSRMRDGAADVAGVCRSPSIAAVGVAAMNGLHVLVLRPRRRRRARHPHRRRGRIDVDSGGLVSTTACSPPSRASPANCPQWTPSARRGRARFRWTVRRLPLRRLGGFDFDDAPTVAADRVHRHAPARTGRRRGAGGRWRHCRTARALVAWKVRTAMTCAAVCGTFIPANRVVPIGRSPSGST